MSDMIVNSYISFPGGGGPPPGPTQFTISGAGDSDFNATDYEDSGASQGAGAIYISRSVNYGGFIGFISSNTTTWRISSGNLYESTQFVFPIRAADVNSKMAFDEFGYRVQWSSLNSRWEYLDPSDTLLDYSSVTTDYIPPVTGWASASFSWNVDYYIMYSNSFEKGTPPLTTDQAWELVDGQEPVPTVTET